MIRRLTLLRHAETLPIAGGQSDADRALTPEGCRQSAMLAEYLKGHAFDMLAISPALRTRETAKRILGGAARFEPLKALYQASADELARIVGSFPAHSVDALVVAHNPGISVFASRLVPAAAGEMSPCAALSFLFDGEWQDGPPGNCRLDWRFSPGDR